MSPYNKTACVSGRPTRRRASTTDSATQEESCHPRKVFVGGLAHKTTTQTLREHFGRYGSIDDAVVLRWPDGRSRGFGYVTFTEVASATAVLQDAHQICGREVDVKRAVPGTNKLFVGGLPQTVAATELRQYFETYGAVSDAVVMIDPATNRSRGFGFVCFIPGHDGAAAVTAALEQYNAHRIRGKWIEVKSAAPPHRLLQEEDKSKNVQTDANESTSCDALPTGMSKRGSRSTLRGSKEGAKQAEQPESSPAASESETCAPPPGLGIKCMTPWPTAAACNVPWPPALPLDASVRTPMSDLPLPTGLPSLLVGSPTSPMKINISRRVSNWVPTAGGEADCMPKATQELTQSLEKLLRLQSQQVAY